jgi:hypothetical protein
MIAGLRPEPLDRGDRGVERRSDGPRAQDNPPCDRRAGSRTRDRCRPTGDFRTPDDRTEFCGHHDLGSRDDHRIRRDHGGHAQPEGRRLHRVSGGARTRFRPAGSSGKQVPGNRRGDECRRSRRGALHPVSRLRRRRRPDRPSTGLSRRLWPGRQYRRAPARTGDPALPARPRAVSRPRNPGTRIRADGTGRRCVARADRGLDQKPRRRPVRNR